MTAFIDESGDLGFSQGSSRFFIAAFVYVEDSHRIRTLIRRQVRGLGFNHFEFKFQRDAELTRSCFLRQLQKMDFEAGVVVARKKCIKEEMRQDKNKLYNFLVLNYMIGDLTQFNYSQVEFVFDRRYSTASIAQFNKYAAWKLRRIFLNKGRAAPNSVFRHPISNQDEGVQIADYIAGSVFQKFEWSDDRWYSLIANKIRYRQPFGTNIDWSVR